MIKKKIILWLFLMPLSAYADWWAQAEFLYWTIKKNGTAIPLVTKASSDPLPGALGQPGTEVEISSCNVRPHKHPGFRVLAATCVSHRKTIDIEARYFLLPNKSCHTSVETSGQPGSPNFAVPVFDTTGVWGLNGIPGETIAVLPGPLGDDPGFDGFFIACSANKVQGAKLNALFEWYEKHNCSLSATTGFGWFQFAESLMLTGRTDTDSNASIPPDFFDFTDRFTSKNNFFGVLLGLRAQYFHNAWRLQTIINGGLGLMRNTATIQGSSQTEAGNLFFLTADTAHETLNGGIFTQPSNIGCLKCNRFGAVFEAIAQAGYSVGEHVEIIIGYNFLLLARTLRAADLIDRNINSTRTSLAQASRATVGIGPGPIPFGMTEAAPAAEGDNSPVRLHCTKNFWAQGLSAGFAIYF